MRTQYTSEGFVLYGGVTWLSAMQAARVFGWSQRQTYRIPNVRTVELRGHPRLFNKADLERHANEKEGTVEHDGEVWLSAIRAAKVFGWTDVWIYNIPGIRTLEMPRFPRLFSKADLEAHKSKVVAKRTSKRDRFNNAYTYTVLEPVVRAEDGTEGYVRKEVSEVLCWRCWRLARQSFDFVELIASEEAPGEPCEGCSAGAT